MASTFLRRPLAWTDRAPVVRPERADRTRSHRHSCQREGTQPHVIDEALFWDALRRERRRGDRFDQVFVVAFVRLCDRTVATLDGVVRSVCAVAGEDTIVGWAHQGEELGVILPDLGLSALGVVQDVDLRLRLELARELGGRSSQRATIRVQLYEGPSAHDVRPAAPNDAVSNGVRAGLWLDGSKRAVDVAFSCLLLLLIWPLLLVIAALIKATSSGPVLFKQVRLGREARPFTMLKFRTMVANADPSLHQQYVSGFIKSVALKEPGEVKLFKLSNDPRVTPIGRLLRRASLDELPQFWNVLIGEMSLVGPRPPLQYELAEYRRWHWRRILECKPGVTGLWQVRGRSRTTFDEMVRMDLQYARVRSLRLDLKIIIVTPFAMISGKGAC